MQNRTSPWLRFLAVALVLATIAAACADDETETAGESTCFADADLEPVVRPDDPMAHAGTELELVAYDSFVVSPGVFDAFEAETGISVNLLTGGDTGTMVSAAVLTAGDPTADVMWGIDNTNLCRALDADVFLPYESTRLGSIDDDLEVDAQHRVTPVDFSDICVNYWIDAVPREPRSLQDLTDPAFAGTFVTQNPETSAPGMGFLLATISAFGDDWEGYWEQLVANDVAVTSGWEDAYYGEFIAGGGDRPVVTSYAASPVAEVVFASEPVDTPPTATLFDSCFRSIEFAGILAGTEHPEAAALLVDFLAGPVMQGDLPLNNFVYPANGDVELPAEFVEFGPLAADPHSLDADVIGANRDGWTERWTQIVLR